MAAAGDDGDAIGRVARRRHFPGHQSADGADAVDAPSQGVSSSALANRGKPICRVAAKRLPLDDRRVAAFAVRSSSGRRI